MEKKHTAKFLRQRKMMIVLPLLVFPFITMAFWALGGGKKMDNTELQNLNTGLNLQLPNANLKDDKNEDKLSFYKEADADSVKRLELLRNDPFYRDSLLTMQSSLMSATENLYRPVAGDYGLKNLPNRSSASINEQKIYQKIAELNKQINQPETATSMHTNPDILNQSNEYKEELSKNVDRMEHMMQTMKDSKEVDPEIQQLNGTLEKILDIQHPQRIKEKMKEQLLPQKEKIFAISNQNIVGNITLLDTVKHTTDIDSGFYSIEKIQNDLNEDNAINAVVHNNQTMINGAVIKLRLNTNIYVSGALIPKGSFIYGLASLNNERLEIEISTIRNSNSIYPVKLEVYDLDGLSGIYIPGAISRDVAKQSADNGLQLMELTTMDPTLKSQLAATGINSVKSLVSKKVKQIKVLVKDGYKVLLKDKNRN